MLWCAHAADPAKRSATAAPTPTWLLRLMEALLVPESTCIRQGSSRRTRPVRRDGANSDETVRTADWLDRERGSATYNNAVNRGKLRRASHLASSRTALSSQQKRSCRPRARQASARSLSQSAVG